MKIPMSTSHMRPNGPARRVLAELRHGPRTVEQISTSLRLTANAVRNQLRKLQDAELAVRSGTRPGASKPSALYSITLEGQIQFSTLYLPVLTHFLRVAEGKCSGTQLESFMTETGKSLAARYARPTGSIKEKTHSAARLLKTFGGITEVHARNGSTTIRSLGCPLSALTAENPAGCNVLCGFLEQYLSTPVHICCNRLAEPSCCFEIGGQASKRG
jgi:predicted ArsR family transcriptional regulator